MCMVGWQIKQKCLFFWKVFQSGVGYLGPIFMRNIRNKWCVVCEPVQPRTHIRHATLFPSSVFYFWCIKTLKCKVFTLFRCCQAHFLPSICKYWILKLERNCIKRLFYNDPWMYVVIQANDTKINHVTHMCRIFLILGTLADVHWHSVWVLPENMCCED